MAGDDGTRDAAGAPEPPAPSGPAPIIDLDGDAVPVRPVKPLGPRRLARLQRELAERARELERSGGVPADPQLLEQQRRFAELAARAQAGNAPSAAGTAVPAAGDAVLPEPAVAEPATPEPGRTEPSTPAPAEQITVVFPDAGALPGADGHVGHDPVHVDPALFSNRLAPGEPAALTHIEILAPAEHHGSHAVAPEGSGAPAPAGSPPAADGLPDPPAPAAAVSAVEEDPDPPAAPVPATAAGGLELLAPHEYRRRAGNRWWVLLPAVLAALAVVLVLLVL